MLNSTWTLLPWLTLFLFFVLVKWLFKVTRTPMVPFFNGQTPERSASDGIAFLLVLSLVVGAAICILIDNGF